MVMKINQSKTDSNAGKDNRFHKFFLIVSIIFFIFSISLYLYVFFAPEPVNIVGAEIDEVDLINSRHTPTSIYKSDSIKQPEKSPQSPMSTVTVQHSPSPAQFRPFTAISPEMQIRINFAGVDEIARLPGIGQKKSAEIVDYRKKHGNFTRKEDIMSVPGIGKKTYKRIKDKIILW